MRNVIQRIRRLEQRLNSTTKVFIMVCAGAGSFWLAMQLAPAPRAPKVDVELAKPAALPQRTVATPFGQEQATPSARGEADTLLLPIATDLRLTPTLTSNPFGPLNAFASQETVAAPVANKTIAPTAPKVRASHMRSPTPPAPPLPALANTQPAPPPVAPALPFVLVGAIQGGQVTDGSTVAFLKHGNNLVVAHAGDTIGTQYRVVSVSPDLIEFLYLPLNSKQTLNIAH